MTGFAGWVNPETMRLMGLALLHFLWQGMAIAAVAFMAMAAVRRAASRYAVAVAMLVLMMAAPGITFFVLQQKHELAIFSAGETDLTRDAQEAALPVFAGANQHSKLAVASQRVAPGYLLWFVEAWFLGVVLLSLRPAAGFLLIERLRLKRGAPVTGALRERCLKLQQRLGLNRMVRYYESLQLEAPAVVGWFRPVVLLPLSALTGLSEQQLEAVVAHELAHVKRLDSFVNLFQIAVETLLFYHPAVWWLSKRIRAERENCCDDVAISVCGNAVEYARALASMAEWQSAPALAMAANRSPLAERVARLLGLTKLSGGLRSAGIAGSVLCLCVSVLAGNALLGAAQTKQNAAASGAVAPVAPVAPAAQATPARDRDAVIVVRPAKPMLAPAAPPPTEGMPAAAPAPPESTDVMTVINGDQEPQAPEDKNESRETSDNEHRLAPKSSYIDGLKAEGLTDLSIDQLIAMKIQNVTAEYVHNIHVLGLKPDVNELIAMRIQSVTPELIRALRDGGMALDVDQIIAMRVQGVTPEYVKQLRDLSIGTDADTVIAPKVQGITGDYVRDMRAVTDPKLSGDELVAMKVQGVTPEYVRELKTLGLQLDADEVIAMKVQGVTPEYIKEMQAAGLKLDTRGAIEAKVQGFTPEFIEKARKHGFQNLTIDKLMALKNSGVLD
jgi:beta-lactamase regulating signal transducer with metallopeptidase domain